MRLINVADLTFKSNAEIVYLIRLYTDRLCTMDASTFEYTIVRDSIEVMQRELAALYSFILVAAIVLAAAVALRLRHSARGVAAGG